MRGLVAIGAFALLGCASQAKDAANLPHGPPALHAPPACEGGPFGATLDAVMPPMERPRALDLFSSPVVNASIEPGCIVPFHAPGDTRTIDVGRVVVRVFDRATSHPKPRLLGRGTLRLGAGALALEAKNDAGDVVLAIAIRGHHATMDAKGNGISPAHFDADIDLDADDPLPLPLDALVASIEGCASDTRIAASADVNVIRATRGKWPLWRVRWLDPEQTAAVDTSVECGADDARLAWRTTAGAISSMLSVASIRAPLALLVEVQRASMTEDIHDPTVAP